MNRGLLITVSGFSGAGKGTLMRRLLERFPDRYSLSVSVTSRKPREGEAEGVHYFFRTKEQFEELIANGGLIEYNCYVDNYYGTPKAFVEEKLGEGKDVLLEIDVNGAAQIKEKYPEAVQIFVTAPSIEELINRLRSRGSETEETIKKRLMTAKTEAKYISLYEHLLVNDDIEDATERIHDIIVTEHNKVVYQDDMIKRLNKELEEVLS